MELTHFPTDSVLRRHAETERNRELGLPPTDSVLRRHYEHLMATLQSAAAPRADAAERPRAPAQLQPAARASAPAPAPAATGGGVVGWVRRLFGM